MSEAIINSADLIVRPAPFDPEKFLGKSWGIIAEERDARSAALPEVDFGQAEFISCLKPGESSIKGEEKLRRLKASGRLRYGASVFHGLWQDYQNRQENSVLETLYRLKNLTYLDFFGDVLLSPDGGRLVLCLYRSSGGEWYWDARWLRGDWPGEVSAVAS